MKRRAPYGDHTSCRRQQGDSQSRRCYDTIGLIEVATSGSLAPSGIPRAGVDVVTLCGHVDQVEMIELPETIAGCNECLRTRGSWVHLRMCLTCGKIGCCDSSPNRHASRHAHEDDHPIARSAELGETWSWCYVDEVGLQLVPS